MTQADFVASMVALGQALRPAPLDPSPVLRLGRALVEEEARPLRRFLASFAERPDWHRSYWLGQTALARAKLSPTGRRAIDLLGADPDLLSPSGDLYDELAHTKTIAWALQRPELALATGEAFLNLLERSGRPHRSAPPFKRGTLDPASLVARSEVVLDGYGRVDVLMDGPTDVILVEGKLHAGEGADQTARYEKAAATFARGRRWTVVFLTLDPDQVPSGRALHLTLRELLAAWVPIAADGSTPAHRHLALYLASLGRVTGVAREGSFDDWTFIERRRALELVTGGGVK